MIPLSAEEVAEALGLDSFIGEVGRVCTDTRSLLPGDLFVALYGDSYNGNAFVPAALAAGGMAAVVGQEATIVGDPAWEWEVGGNRIYRVSDSVKALGALGRAVRRKSEATVLAVTGSVGKTGTKDILAAMLSACGETVSTAANENNEIGVPRTLFRLESSTRTAVVEMGMRGEGQIAELMGLAEPDVAVITTVAPVHLEVVGDMEAVVRAKAEALYNLPAGGIGVVPFDHPLLDRHAEVCGRKVVRFGVEEEEADVVVHVLDKDVRRDRARIEVSWPGGSSRIEVPFLSGRRIHNTAAAAAACFAAGLPMEECLKGLEHVRFTPLRGDGMRVGGVLILDDSYNASPVSVRAALQDVAERAADRGGRSVAVLGDMLELGAESERYHREVGEHARLMGVDELWSAGDYSQTILDGFLSEAGPEIEASDQRAAESEGHLIDMESLEATLGKMASGLGPGDVILVKASRGMRLERVAEGLREILETRSE